MLPLDHTWRNSEAWNKTKTPGALANEDKSWRHPTQGIVWRRPRRVTHRGWHPMARILWVLIRWIMELNFHNQDVWAHKWRGVILHKATLTTYGTKEGIEKSLCKPPPIIKDCSLSTPKDHSPWKARG
jgi:hypothetical protein